MFLVILFIGAFQDTILETVVKQGQRGDKQKKTKCSIKYKTTKKKTSTKRTGHDNASKNKGEFPGRSKVRRSDWERCWATTNPLTPCLCHSFLQQQITDGTNRDQKSHNTWLSVCFSSSWTRCTLLTSCKDGPSQCICIQSQSRWQPKPGARTTEDFSFHA